MICIVDVVEGQDTIPGKEKCDTEGEYIRRKGKSDHIGSGKKKEGCRV